MEVNQDQSRSLRVAHLGRRFIDFYRHVKDEDGVVLFGPSKSLCRRYLRRWELEGPLCGVIPIEARGKTKTDKAKDETLSSAERDSVPLSGFRSGEWTKVEIQTWPGGLLASPASSGTSRERTDLGAKRDEDGPWV